MGKMKELFIHLMEEDWEYLPSHEKAIIQAEKEYQEMMLTQQILAEEQLAAQIKVIKEQSEKANSDAAANKDNNKPLPF